MYRLMHNVLNFSLIPGLLLLFASSAAADLTARVTRDLEPVAGFLVLPAGGQSVIDLDAEDGVRAGDLFSVLGTGEKLVHPTTGEALGTLEAVKGVLRVEKVDKGFSLASPVLEDESFARGDAIRRFYKIPARFWDYAGSGEPLYLQLKDQLADLEWSAYSEAQASRPAEPGALRADRAALLFVLTKSQTLEIRDNRFELLHSYRIPAGLLTSEKQPPTPAGAIVTAAPTAPASGIVQAEKPAVEGVWYGPDFSDSPVGIEVGNLDRDNGNEIAVLFEHRLEIGRFAGKTYAKTAEVDLGHGQKALLLDGADLNGDGVMELYITAASDGQLASLVVEQTDRGFEVTETFIPWYFRKVDLAGEGPVLLGQRMGEPRQDFVGPIFRVRRQGSEATEGEAVELPRDVNVLNFAPLGPADGSAVARLSRLGNLQVIDRSGDRLWQSIDDFGGSESYIKRTNPDEAPQTGDATRNHYLTARMLRLADDTVLVPVNEGTDFISRLRTFKRSRLRAMQWNGHVMNELWHTKPVDAYLSDFRIADVNGDGRNEIIMSTVFTRKGLFSKGRSSLMAIELP